MKYVGENALKKWTSLVKSDIKKKLDKNQGTANSGKILGVDATGEVAPTDTEVATLVDVPNGIVKGDGSTLSAAVAGTDYMAPPTGGTAGQVLKKTETGTEWADAPVPDWNQNDSTAADYVKNRPFYTGGPVETVLIEESTVAFTAEDSGIYIAQFPSTFEATVGETYKVSWDGTVYECVCAKYNGIPIIGNLSIVNAGSDTGEPFVIGIEDGVGLFIYATNSSSHTFSISGMVAQVVKIDPKYLPDSFKPEGKSYITFSSPNSFTLAVENAKKNWDGTLEYFASDRTWTTWDGTAAIYSVDNYGEYVLYLRGTGNTVIAGKNYDYRWVLTGNDIKCIGNIENLLDYATVKSGNHPTMASKCYGYMFAGCNALTKAPDLPATTLASDCYLYMFSDCTNLTQAPALPATTLADSCYNSMFYDCTSLTQAPALPATTLASYCYKSMFGHCTSLTQAPALPATTLADNCYNSMFRGCTSLNQAPALPATTLATQCYYYMFYGCINLTKASDLSATTLADHCCYYMFSDCTSLTQAPALPATTLASYCYSNIFQGCTSLTQAPALPATMLASYCYSNMFQGCTSLTQAPALPATTLAQNCYRFMFRNCSKLKLSSTQTEEYVQEYRIPYSGIGTTETDALYNMFYSTGGTFTGTPEINTTYYLSSDNMIARETEVATLNGYVGSMIKGLATQEYVDGKVPDGGTAGQVLTKTADGQEWKDREKDFFVVTFTYSGTYNADKTFAEIKAANDAGKICYANFLGTICSRSWISDQYVTFVAIDVRGSSESISATAAFVRMYKDNSIVFNGMPLQPNITASGLLKGDGSGGVSAAVAGTDYVTPSDMTSAIQSAIQNTWEASY